MLDRGPSVWSLALLLASLLTGATAAAVAAELPVLPNAGDGWRSDPWSAGDGPGDPLLSRTGKGARRLGPFSTARGEWHLQTEAPHDAAAFRLIRNGEPTGTVAVQRFHRRLVVGPIEEGDGEDRRNYWVLLRQGRVRLVTQHGDPTFFADELEFDLAFDAIDLGSLNEAQLTAWVQSFWECEARIWEAAAREE